MEEITISPCPFCGNEQIDYWDEAVRDGFYYCEPCGLCGPRANTRSDAREKWNALPRHEKKDFYQSLHFHSGLPSRLRWTQETPTVEGMYWCRCIDPQRRIAGPANIMYYTPGCTLVEMYDEFAGPIPEPEE